MTEQVLLGADYHQTKGIDPIESVVRRILELRQYLARVTQEAVPFFRKAHGSSSR